MSRESILELVGAHESVSKAELQAILPGRVSDATLKRMLQQLVTEEKLEVTGRGRATRYRLSTRGRLLSTINLNAYFSREIDERIIITHFNFDLLTRLLPGTDLFTQSERAHLQQLQHEFKQRFSELSEQEKHKELTRLGIDLSWKSSQIEGNTYTLLETERLLLEQQTASGRTRDEATMLLNHKAALDFVTANPDYLQHLSIAHIENIHTLLVRN